MARADIFFPRDTHREELQTTLGIPVRFRVQSDQREAALQTTDNSIMLGWDRARHIVDIRHGFLTNQDLKNVSGVLFEGNRVLDETLPQTGFSKPTSLEATRLQNGTFAHHLLWEAENESKRHSHFVAYISRFPITTILGQLAEEDYRNLLELHNRSTFKRVRVVKPYAFGTFTYRNGIYPFYTSEYNEIGGELHMSYNPFAELPSGEHLGFPVFHHPIADGEQMDGQNQYIVSVFDMAKSVFMKTEQRNGINRALSELMGSPAAVLSQKQQVAIVQACASLFRLAGNRYPTQQAINAGDWMAEIRKGVPTNFTLVTTRGHMEALTDAHWIDWMMSNREFDKETGRKYYPFSSFIKGEDYAAILRKI